uniref:Putative secreted protein n=1 Tax=Anopheles marajoara TaxID=58244 RepID=A0A2M4C7N6_9DIPT
MSSLFMLLVIARSSMSTTVLTFEELLLQHPWPPFELQPVVEGPSPLPPLLPLQYRDVAPTRPLAERISSSLEVTDVRRRCTPFPVLEPANRFTADPDASVLVSASGEETSRDRVM